MKIKRTYEYFFRVCFEDQDCEIVKVSKTKATKLLTEIQCIPPVTSAGIIKCLKS